jgi:hypothetical protein
MVVEKQLIWIGEMPINNIVCFFLVCFGVSGKCFAEGWYYIDWIGGILN